jgi:two-component system chemotaxis response regulator CheB
MVPPGQRIRMVAIGASTGGPQVLSELLAAQPRSLAAPILIVQHITRGFTEGLVQWLQTGTGLTVKLAEHGEPTLPGNVYVAPDGVQLGVTSDSLIRLAREKGVEGFCPSVSYLFESVARAFGRSAVGVILTGMGRDGATGLRTLRAAGGVTVAQDRDSSTVFGMPAEAIRLAAAQHVLSPGAIAQMIRTLVAEG